MKHLGSICCSIALALIAGQSPVNATYITYYDNTTTFSGYGYAGGGATAGVNGSTTTTMIADDVTPAAGFAGSSVNSITFSVANFNSTAVSARAELFIYDSTGSSGGPGSLISELVFNPISFTAGSVGLYNYSQATSIFTLPSGTFWAGLSFDDAGGTTGASAAQLNNLGAGIFSPPAIGSSQDLFFQSDSATSNASNNPAGGFYYFGGTPPANFGFAFAGTPIVPEPSSVIMTSLAIVMTFAGSRFARSRRAASQAA